MPVTINGTSGLSGVDGSAGTPAVQGTDTNTGIFYPAADTIAFGEGGTEVMRIDSAGNVGIGTTSPTQKLDVSGSINATGTVTMGSSFLRNRIINGDMRIDQRNAGAAVTPAASAYTVDRWELQITQASKVTAQQGSGITGPGFSKSIILTTAAAVASPAATDYFSLRQGIEGFNIADLDFGTASAKSFTLSFWVQSTLTGNFGGSVTNGAANRSYPFTYNISAANTWQYKTITIPGDTSGTWLTTNGAGLNLFFTLGAGSTYTGTANTWAGSFLATATGSTSVIGALSASLIITGVQLEAGSVATPFERRLYGQELALCQRYYQTRAVDWRFYGAAAGGYYTPFTIQPMRANATTGGTFSYSNASAGVLVGEATGRAYVGATVNALGTAEASNSTATFSAEL